MPNQVGSLNVLDFGAVDTMGSTRFAIAPVARGVLAGAGLGIAMRGLLCFECRQGKSWSVMRKLAARILATGHKSFKPSMATV